MERRGTFAGALRGLAVIGLIGMVALALLGTAGLRPGRSGAARQTITPTAAPVQSASAQPMDTVTLVDRVAPAVVTVNNLRRLEGFGAPDDPQQAGSGTGFIIDEQGHIVTNNHVVEGGDEFEVFFAYGD